MAAEVEASLPYTVRVRDKLIVLSKDLLQVPGDWPKVARFNAMPDPNRISPGQVLKIPLSLLKFSAATGRLVSAEGDVQVGGVRATPASAIGEGARLQVGANSSAVIELGDGSRIKLLQNSQAEVVSNRLYSIGNSADSASTNWFSGLMRLTRGAVEAVAAKSVNRATPLQITTPTSVVGVRGTQFRVAFDDPATNNSRSEVIEGLVRADNPAQQSGAELPQGTGAIINPAQKEVMVVKLLSAPDMTQVPGELFKPQGAWPLPSLAGAAAYRVQVAIDEKFDKIVQDQKVTGSTVDLGSLATGAWYARVRGIDAVGLEGMDAVKQIAMRERWRTTSSILMLVDGRTELAWSGVQADGRPLIANSYSVEVARDQAFTQLVARTEGERQRLVLGALTAGTYFVRIHARVDGRLIESDPYTFELSAGWGVSVFDLPSALRSIPR